MARTVDRDHKVAVLERLCREAMERRARPGWVSYAYMREIGSRPGTLPRPDGWREYESEWNAWVAGAKLEDKQREFDRLCTLCIAEGYKPGWVYIEYERTFGVRPATQIVVPQSFLEYAEARGERGGHFSTHGRPSPADEVEFQIHVDAQDPPIATRGRAQTEKTVGTPWWVWVVIAAVIVGLAVIQNL